MEPGWAPSFIMINHVDQKPTQTDESRRVGHLWCKLGPLIVRESHYYFLFSST
jgi:hypothetical protein